NSGASQASAIRLPILSSCCQLEYFAQALKRHLTAEICGAFSDRTKVQPESRVHTRLVGQRWKRTFSFSALARLRTLRASFSEAGLLTMTSIRSCRERLRMISA